MRSGAWSLWSCSAIQCWNIISHSSSSNKSSRSGKGWEGSWGNHWVSDEMSFWGQVMEDWGAQPTSGALSQRHWAAIKGWLKNTTDDNTGNREMGEWWGGKGSIFNKPHVSKKGENEGGGKGTEKASQAHGHLAGRMKRISELWTVGQGEQHGNVGGERGAF